jgi:quinol monooxygenase YgiN
MLLVSLHFDSIAERDAWIEIWRPLAAYVQAHEPHTLAFELAVADTDAGKVVVAERYRRKADFVGAHRSSAAFLAYKSAAEALPFRPRVSGQSYFESGVGFI